MSDKAIKEMIQKARNAGEIVREGRLNLPGRDQRIDVNANNSLFEIRTLEAKVNIRDKLSKTPTQSPYIEKLVKAKVAAVAGTIRSMRRVQPIETAIYCMTTEEMKKRSVMTIVNLSTANEIKTMGLFDKALGCIQKGKSCITCYRKYGECEGHEGYIPFARKHVNPYFAKEVIYILRCRCQVCGHVYATKEFIEFAGLKKLSGLAYLKALAELSEGLHGLHDHGEVVGHEHYLNEMKDHKIVYRLTSRKGPNVEEYSVDLDNVEYTFQHFNDNDLEILGFTGRTHPAAFIMSGMLAISPHLRLPVHVNGKSENHPITARYIQIIKYSEQIRQSKDLTNEAVNGLLAIQYSKIKEIFFGPENKSTIRSGEQDFGLITNLTGKRGLLRFHAMGKRTNSAARSVANPSVDGNNGEIGIPRSMQHTITVKEKVHQYNRRKLAEGIRTGKIQYVITIKEGAETKQQIKTESRSQFRLEIGMTVERPIDNGDIVICGRQPSLHAASLLGFRVYLHDDEVIKVSIENLAGFNLDFDGDEVTVYVMQTIPARVEAVRNASSMYHLMNEQANRPMMGVAFHGLLGSYLGTETWNYVSYDDFDDDEFNDVTESVLESDDVSTIRDRIQDVVGAHVDRIRGIMEAEIARAPDKTEAITNETNAYVDAYEQAAVDVMAVNELNVLRLEYRRMRSEERNRIRDRIMTIPRSVMIPEERFIEAIARVNDSHRKRTLRERCERAGVPYSSGRALLSLAFPRFDYTSGSEKKNDLVIIKDGILVKGVLRKSNIGTGDKSIIQQIVKLYSIEEADRFLNDILKLADWFVMWHGFSIGQQTFVTDRRVIGGKIVNEVNLIQNRFYNIGPMPKDTSELFFWKRAVHGMMDRGLNFGKDVGNSVLKKSNGLNVLGTDGCAAKGSYMNTSQITGLLGCQKLQGDIQAAELNNMTRRLVTFLPDDCSLESIGYIVESFYTGLRASGLFFHMASSREGLVDTANNTAIIGYTHRRLEKVLEDLIFDSRGMFTSLMGKIYVFTYSCIAIALQLFVETPETGRILSYCDFKATANMVNGVYERMALTARAV